MRWSEVKDLEAGDRLIAVLAVLEEKGEAVTSEEEKNLAEVLGLPVGDSLLGRVKHLFEIEQRAVKWHMDKKDKCIAELEVVVEAGKRLEKIVLANIAKDGVLVGRLTKEAKEFFAALDALEKK